MNFVDAECDRTDGNTLDNQTVLTLLKQIGNNDKFKTTLRALTLFKLPDSALYFLSQFDRILSDSFVATSEDIIRMRRATTGIQVDNQLIVIIRFNAKIDIYRRLYYSLERSTSGWWMLAVRDQRGGSGYIALRMYHLLYS